MVSKNILLCLLAHILSEIEHICDYVVFIDKGKIIKQGSLDKFKLQKNKTQKYYFEFNENAKLLVDKLKKCEGGSGFLRSIIMSPDMKSFEVEFEDGAEKKNILEKICDLNLDLLEMKKSKSTLESFFNN